MTRYEEIEAVLASISQDLAHIKENQESQARFIEQVLMDRLPHTPLIRLYQRPKFAPSDC